MIKFTLGIIYSTFFFLGLHNFFDKPAGPAVAPPELTITPFSGPEVTPSPACLAVAPTGEVFVGIDMIGSLGKDPGKGRILKLIDQNNDGKMDQHVEFATVDNPRGIIAKGDQVFVLHTTFSKETGKATGMALVVFEDKDGDGKADGPSKPLIENLSNTKYIQERGTDHATNGIRMGIDGWIYIAVGDFGFHNATDRSGKKLTMLGGGIVRVRPDGTEMEVYTHGTRNVYDVAIDPYMNVFTRENTNDGGGWNVRFSHHIQSGEYGYPLLFQHFTDEMLPALADLGGGSGTGALFMDEPNWPEKYNNVPMMADWGRSMLYIHRVTTDGPTFTQKEEDFIKLPQITDLDVDGSGRLYLSAWDGAGYSGSPTKGYIVRAVPKNWTYKEFPNLTKASVKQLAELLKSASAVARLSASQELISRPAKQTAKASLKVASDQELPLYARVAAIFTYAQAMGENSIPALVQLSQDESIREFALRALTDRKNYLEKVPVEPFLSGLKDPSVRVQAIAAIGLGRLERKDAAAALLQTKTPASFVAPEKDIEGPHATPNSAIVLPHLAVQALVRMNAEEACIAAISTENSSLALWALRYMHSKKTVDGLISAYNQSKNENVRKQILITLSRLYRKESAYDASWWWGTRPDSHGPYYKTELWESSPAIESFLIEESKKAGINGKPFFADLNERHRMDIAAFAVAEKLAAAEEPKVDLEKIKNKKGQVGKSSIEDVLLAIAKLEGDPVKGKALFTSQGCIACHSINKGEKMKGPFMGQVGSIMNREQIAESILKPNASISQGFATVMISAKGDKTYMGFITEETATKVVMRNIAGEVFNIKAADILSRKEMDTSMMPAGLANSLSYEELASLVTFLSQQKK
ncbi:putative heme-binding domain-containing protein [Pedobacter steynii]|uniref:Putative heme-binding domain-containing protein n=1 Tax=Pedobacter steynii TaxID=430522 RepID=A0A1G9L4J2_9SPHI|nr:c-type cytochrome [Pedobacter steynii]NQX38729.1 c-type cytochrome [Pedobacter steynii]SDL56647.1 putative heme-binding domain-containing protein [Pedobacter steynii]